MLSLAGPESGASPEPHIARLDGAVSKYEYLFLSRSGVALVSRRKERFRLSRPSRALRPPPCPGARALALGNAMDKYTPTRRLGEGTYGVVVHARSIDGTEVAIKCMRLNLPSWEHAQNLREVQVLCRLPPHPDVVRLLEVVREGATLYMVFEYMRGGSLLEHQRAAGRLSERDVRNVFFQVMQGLAHLHGHGVMHRDVKPENILVAGPCVGPGGQGSSGPDLDGAHSGDRSGGAWSLREANIKLGDFGLAKPAASKPHTQYCTTRWYRSPECIVRSPSYGPPADIWAAACCLAEALGGAPLFPGSSEADQLDRICELLGVPEFGQKKSFDATYKGLPSLLSERKLRETSYSFERCRAVLRALLGCSECAADLLTRCLTWDPAERLTAEQCLAHPFFSSRAMEQRL